MNFHIPFYPCNLLHPRICLFYKIKKTKKTLKNNQYFKKLNLFYCLEEQALALQIESKCIQKGL